MGMKRGCRHGATGASEGQAFDRRSGPGNSIDGSLCYVERGAACLDRPPGGVGSVLLTGKESVGRGRARADDSHPPSPCGPGAGLRSEVGASAVSGRGVLQDGKLCQRAAPPGTRGEHWVTWPEFSPEFRAGLADRAHGLLCSARS